MLYWALLCIGIGVGLIVGDKMVLAPPLFMLAAVILLAGTIPSSNKE